MSKEYPDNLHPRLRERVLDLEDQGRGSSADLDRMIMEQASVIAAHLEKTRDASGQSIEEVADEFRQRKNDDQPKEIYDILVQHSGFSWNYTTRFAIAAARGDDCRYRER